MKVRVGYVSNSSSSSYVIAYDACFFGNLMALFEECYAGCETKVTDDMEEILDRFDEEERDEIQGKILAKKKEGKQVLYISLDSEFGIMMSLIKMINESNGSNKVEFLLDMEE